MRGFLRCGLSIALASLVFLGMFARVGFTLCESFPFEEQLRKADLIFVGSVDKKEFVGRGIIARYSFSNLRYAKGTGPKSSLTLAQAVNTEDEPSFQVGNRYVVLAWRGTEEGFIGYYRAMPCVWGPFGIWTDSSSGSSVVHFRKDVPILAVRDRYLLVLRAESWEAAHAPSAYQVFERSPRRSLDEELRLADSTYATDRKRQNYPRGVRIFALWPHQDPGTRVTEGEFVDWLARVMAGDTGAPKDAPPRR